MEKQLQVTAIVGCGGFGREVASYHDASASIVFAQSEQPPEDTLNGRPRMALEKFYALALERRFLIAIANGQIRARLAEELARHATPSSFIALNAHVGHGVHLAEGAIICPFVSLTADATIGKHFHANIYSYVAHDCIIGDFVTFAPSVCCNGNVRIGDHAYIGTGAKLIQGTQKKPLKIGRNAVVGMGAIVLEDVPDGATVVGNPARIVSVTRFAI